MATTRLTVRVAGSEVDGRLLALPIDVMTRAGDRLAQVVASPSEPASLELTSDPATLERVYVVASLPTGERMQKMVSLKAGNNDVTLSTIDRSPDDWLAWVAPFVSLPDFGAESKRKDRSDPARRRIGPVWMTLWRLEGKKWIATDVTPMATRQGQGRRQISLRLPLKPHLLQVGGEAVSWRLISLPSGGETRVALTGTREGRQDAVDIAVSRVDAQNELIMAYLAEGAIGSVDRLTDAWHAADIALYRKREDPVSAAAGAYLLLRLDRLHSRSAWIDNLVEWFPWLSDGPIVAAALALRSDDYNERDVRKFLKVASERGVPLFSYGASLLVETMAAVHRGGQEAEWFKKAYQRARLYLAAASRSSIYFAFHGLSPLEPSSTPVTGPENNRINFDLRDQAQASLVGRATSTKGNRGVRTRRPRLRSQGTTEPGRYEVLASLLAPTTATVPKGFSLADQRSGAAYTVFDDEE